MEIINPLPDEFRRQAAEIYWDAFSGKLGKFLNPRDRAVNYFERVIVRDQAFAAIHQGRLVGLAGFDTGQGGVIGGGFRDFWANYGIGTFWRMPGLALFIRHVDPGTLQMDGIAVAQGERGRGVGTALFKALFEMANENGYKKIALDVIDRNPNAKALYQRLGFEVVDTVDVGFLAPLFGFRSSDRMMKFL